MSFFYNVLLFFILQNAGTGPENSQRASKMYTGGRRSFLFFFTMRSLFLQNAGMGPGNNKGQMFKFFPLCRREYPTWRCCLNCAQVKSLQSAKSKCIMGGNGASEGGR